MLNYNTTAILSVREKPNDLFVSISSVVQYCLDHVFPLVLIYFTSNPIFGGFIETFIGLLGGQ